MTPGPARGRWLALLCAVALAAWPARLHAAPEDPPAGYVWEDCKAVHARMLRPAVWLSKQDATGLSYFSPEPFAASNWLEKGLTFYSYPVSKVETGKTADEEAATEIAGAAGRHRVWRGTTKVGWLPGPFTTYSLTFAFDRQADGKSFAMTEVLIANRETNTLYVWLLRSPRAEWREVEAFEDVMLKSLQLDPKF